MIRLELLLRKQKKYLGVKYKYGGNTPAGFDCSGLVQYCYKQVGVTLPRTTSQLINKGKSVSQGNLQVGDLVFPKAGHVGLYVGDGKFIHAPKTGDVVKISNVYSFYAGRRVA